MYQDKIDIHRVVLAEEYCMQWSQKWQALVNQMQAPLKQLELNKAQLSPLYASLDSLLATASNPASSTVTEDLRRVHEEVQARMGEAMESAKVWRADLMS